MATNRDTVLFNLCHSLFHRGDLENALFYGRQIIHYPNARNLVAEILLCLYETTDNPNYLNEGIANAPSTKYLGKLYFKKSLLYPKNDPIYLNYIKLASEMGEQHAILLLAEHILSRAMFRNDNDLLDLARKWLILAAGGNCTHGVQLARKYLLLIYSIYISRFESDEIHYTNAMKYGRPILLADYELVRLIQTLLGETHNSIVLYMRLCQNCYQLCYPYICSSCGVAIYCSSYW